MVTILRKLAILIPTVLAVSLLTFLLLVALEKKGNPAILVLGPQGADPEAVAQVEEDLRLNDPLAVRYASWLGDAATGDLGYSYLRRQSVSDAIVERLPVTLEIGGLALVFALLMAIPFGVFSAYRANSTADKAITTSTFGLLAVPTFVMALLLIYLFAVKLDVLPSSGWTRFTDNPSKNLQGAILPALSLGLAEFAVYSRLLRTDMISTLQQDFITMAKAKGLPTWRILLRHALRPSSLSLVTVVGLQVGGLIGGSVIIEQLFALPGLGRLLVESIIGRDLITVQGVVLFLSVSYVVVNFLVDLLYAVLDPRIRHG